MPDGVRVLNQGEMKSPGGQLTAVGFCDHTIQGDMPVRMHILLLVRAL
jgi:hypothetical protein